MEKVTNNIRKHVLDTRKYLASKKRYSQIEINEISSSLAQYKSIIMPQEKNELFLIVDENGKDDSCYAERWLCHLLGLRHRAVHLLILYNNIGLGKVCVLQTRALHKFEYPGHIDISVGGHVIENDLLYETVIKETKEELGLDKSDMIGDEILHIDHYNIDDIDDSKLFHNSEYRALYLAQIDASSLDKINFIDKEVVGLYLSPLENSRALLNQSMIPVANALKESLPFYLNYFDI